MKALILAAALLLLAAGHAHPGAAHHHVRSGAIPAHVQTATYLWSSTEYATSPTVYAPYLTYAYVKNGLQAAAAQAAGLKVVAYTTPIMANGTVFDYTLLSSYPSAIARNCSGAQITVYKNTGKLTDPRLTIAETYYTAVAQHAISAHGGHVDYVFVDNASDVYYNADNPPPCGWTAAAWGFAIDNAVAQIPRPVVLNALSVSLAAMPTYVGYERGANVAGAQYEECYNIPGQWMAEEESQRQSVALLKSQGKPGGPGWWCYRDITSAPGSGLLPERVFEYASFLLTYDPAYSVFQESYVTTPSTFQVYPETGFVPLQPLRAIANTSDLRTASGAYVRDYAACYYRGAARGPCEVAANPSTTATVSLPNAYRNSMTISGGGILDGGSAGFSGPAVTSLGPLRGAILINPAGTPTPTPTAAPTPTPTAAPTPTPTAAPTTAPTAAPTAAPTPTATPAGQRSGTVYYLSNYDGCFWVRESTGATLEVCPESYTAWTNKAALAVGRTVTASGYVNQNRVLIASSIVVK